MYAVMTLIFSLFLNYPWDMKHTKVTMNQDDHPFGREHLTYHFFRFSTFCSI
jgi:hypothetical protein